MIFFNIKQEDDNTVSSPNFCLKEKNHKKSWEKKQKKKKRKGRTWAGLDSLGARACLCPSPFVNKNRKI